jgi:hypothetical protein
MTECTNATRDPEAERTEPGVRIDLVQWAFPRSSPLGVIAAC